MLDDPPPFEFDVATTVRPRGDGTFDIDVDPGFTVGPKPNGGYLLATAANAAGEALASVESGHRDPIAATAHFLWAPDPGPAEVQTQVLRVGNGASQVRATVVQDGRPCVEATFTMATLTSAPSRPWWSGTTPPAVAPIEDCVRLPAAREGAPFVVSIMDRSDLRLDPAVIGFARGKPSGEADLRGWIAFADGRPVDALGLLFFIDALPPATFELAEAGWVPTLSLTAYVRARPAPGPLIVRQWAQVVDGGRFDEVCELWDATGRLVAQATQLAAIRIPEGLEPPTRP
ncbi:thioesterase family protein [Aquihabitans sp. G128]|uniref:acyl-CoA thioesterase n=1 Tax=Aquihabitans sp. G128 TaxID=2849779 RepID=UPI001C210BA3|nr:thioesterase family protein [Aquihabitans sp. G128]QXC59876.1 thioesterase family protein [Aquihabitans sp. G128]